MYRGTTPLIRIMFVADEIDLCELKGLWITFKSPSVEMTFSKDEILIDPERREAFVSMSQNDTLRFGFGKVAVQARFLMEDGSAYATDVVEMEVYDILMEGVVEVEDDPADGPGGEPDGPVEDPGGDEVPEGPGGELQQPDGET